MIAIWKFRCKKNQMLSDNDPTSEARDHSKGTNGPVPSDNADSNNENRCIHYPTQIRKFELMQSKTNPTDTKHRNILPQCKLQLLTLLLPSYVHLCCIYHEVSNSFMWGSFWYYGFPQWECTDKWKEIESLATKMSLKAEEVPATKVYFYFDSKCRLPAVETYSILKGDFILYYIFQYTYCIHLCDRLIWSEVIFSLQCTCMQLLCVHAHTRALFGWRWQEASYSNCILGEQQTGGECTVIHTMSMHSTPS